MGDRENPKISSLDNANAAQQLIRDRARRLVDMLSDTDIRTAERIIEDIIKATERTQGYLKELRPERNKTPGA